MAFPARAIKKSNGRLADHPETIACAASKSFTFHDQLEDLARRECGLGLLPRSRENRVTFGFAKIYRLEQTDWQQAVHPGRAVRKGYAVSPRDFPAFDD